MKHSWRLVVVLAVLLALLQQALLSRVPAFPAGAVPPLPVPASIPEQAMVWMPFPS